MFFPNGSIFCKSSFLHYTFFMFLICLFPTISHSDETSIDSSHRYGYSSLGLGYELLSLKEDVSLSSQDTVGETWNINIESDYSGGNFAQRSLVYVAVDELWGFYIGSGSTLSSLKNNETWNATVSNETSGTVYSDLKIQSNTTTLSRSELSLLAVREFSNNHSFLFGVRYNSFTYKRFDFKAHAEDVFTSLVLPEGDISEESTAFIAQVGYEYNEFFTSQAAGWRTQFQVIAGVVIYNRVQNTEKQISQITFDDTFNGFDLKATASIGYQFGGHFMLAAALDTHYQSYQKIDQENASIPDNEFSYVQPSINALWSF